VAGLGWLVLNTLLGPERTTRTVPGGAFVVLAPLGGGARVVPGVGVVVSVLGLPARERHHAGGGDRGCWLTGVAVGCGGWRGWGGRWWRVG
jgi:hypothetical protein